VVELGAFLVCLNPEDDSRYLNQAIPAAGAARAAVRAAAPRVRELMAARRRLPRVEAIAGAVPGLEEELAAQAWELEARLPVMAATPATVRAPSPPPGLRLVRVDARADASLVRRLLETQRGPVGLDPHGLDEAEVRRWSDGAGATGVLAELYGIPVAAGQLTPVTAGLAEVVGIATRAP
ncbi:MAG TPA: hypothetical protein VLA98_15380, partial [Solirubrobacteraceae bacterium]|nr:hypothetical protein [Solirubrobacteraceae bacterium]